MFCAYVGMAAAVPFTFFVLGRLFEEHSAPTKLSGWMESSKGFWFCAAISFCGLLAMIVFAFSKSLGLDEAFSLALVKHESAEVVRLTALDVHPPLYYLILKFSIDGIHFLFPDIPAVYSAKLVSTAPYVILWVVSMTKVRKDWGNAIAGMWMLCVTGTSYLIDYGVEIRMYSWAVLFVSLAFLSVNDIVNKKQKAGWVRLILFSLASAYTHYYACIAAGMCYLLLFIWFAANEKKQMKRWFLAAAITIAGYLPWLFVLIGQLQTVSGDYWISPITVPTILYYLVYAFDNPLFLLLCMTLVIRWIKEWKGDVFHKWTCFFSVGGILVPLGVILVGTIVSVIVNPVFIYRYEIPALACLWLGFLTGCIERKERVREFAFCLAALAALSRICAFTYSEQGYRVQSGRTAEFLEANGKDAVYFCGSADLYGLMVLEGMTDCRCYIWEKEIDNLSVQVYEKIDTLGTEEELMALVEQEGSVYFMGDKETAEELIQDCDLELKEAGSYQVRGMVDFYQIVPGVQ